MTTHMLKVLDRRGSFLFSVCRPRFSRLKALPLNARARAILSLNLKEKRDFWQSNRFFSHTKLYNFTPVGAISYHVPPCIDTGENSGQQPGR